jgi:hypothetical protein
LINDFRCIYCCVEPPRTASETKATTQLSLTLFILLSPFWFGWLGKPTTRTPAGGRAQC